MDFVQKITYVPGLDGNIVDCSHYILGIPWDGSQTERIGSRFAPEAVRRAMLHSYGVGKFFESGICDLGDVEVCHGSWEQTAKRAKSVMSQIGEINPKAMPIVLGGEHSITQFVAPATKADLVIVFDAHLDLLNEFDGFRFSHACASRRVLDAGKKVAVIGAADFHADEAAFAKRAGVQYFTADQVRKAGIESILRKLKAKRPYISIDLDVFSPAVAPGASCINPVGLDLEPVRTALAALSPKAVGIDFVEYCPLYDKGETAALITRLMMESVAAAE